jgi:hypothetical protein
MTSASALSRFFIAKALGLALRRMAAFRGKSVERFVDVTAI